MAQYHKIYLLFVIPDLIYDGWLFVKRRSRPRPRKHRSEDISSPHNQHTNYSLSKKRRWHPSPDVITFTIDIKIHTDPHNNPTTRVLLLPAVAVWLLLLHLVPPTHRVIPDKYNLRSYQVQTFKPPQTIHQNKDPQINCRGKNSELAVISGTIRRTHQQGNWAALARVWVQGYRGTGVHRVMMWVQRYRAWWCGTTTEGGTISPNCHLDTCTSLHQQWQQCLHTHQYTSHRSSSQPKQILETL